MKIGELEIEPERYYPDKEASAFVGKTPGTLATDRSRRRGIPYTKVSRKIFYLGRDIIQHIEKGRVVFR